MKSSDFLFCVSEEDGSFCLTSKEYWEAEGVLDDCLAEIDCLPEGFHNLMEATWEYYDPSITDLGELVQVGKKKLLEAGFVWSEDMNQFLNSQ